MKTTYTEKELSELAVGVFRDDKTSPRIYADASGTFRTPQQYDELKKEGKHEPFKFVFENPNNKQVPKTQAEVDAKSAQRIAELEVQVAELESQLADAKTGITRLTDENTDLQAKLAEAQAPK